MKNFIALLVLLTGAYTASAQKYSISGTVADSARSPLPSSTVMLLNAKDSTLINFGVTDVRGAFEIKNVSLGDYLLKITFVGYSPFEKKISASGNLSVINVGLIKMEAQNLQLGEVVIRGEKAPVTVKRDTIEFNAGSFKTKANANVEDLLKKMPGMEVDTDGTVRAQGTEVQRVMVDGREFFGRDPKLATRNLPADVVDKVQVFDKRSDQAVFTGIDDGVKEKTINLELKEDKRNGAFGNVMAGYGSNDRFQGKASINRFGKGQQISFLGMGNNINEQGFSFGDFMNFTGGSQQMMGGGGGRMSIQIDGNNNNGVPLNFGGRQNGIMTNYA
ncbi:MAG: carboxypeptidase-like regulatory domain-containing protein, partial [Cytophagales bacterium]